MAALKRNKDVNRRVQERLKKARAAKAKTAKAPAKATTAKAPAKPRPRKLPALRRERTAAEELLLKAQIQGRKQLQEARTDLAEARKLLARIRQDFYDVGLRLARLKRPAAYGALGYESFAELVEAELDMSHSVANRLVGIVENVSRELALQVGQSHAWALVRLAAATEEEDTPDELAAKTLKLPTGEKLHIPTASVRAKNAAAVALRSTSRTSKRGNSSSPEEHQIAKDIEASLRALGVSKARVRAKPTRPGRSAELELKGVPMSALEQLCRALCPAG